MTVGLEFERLLQDAMGLNPISIGTATVERAVLGRMSACKLPDPSLYWQHLCASEDEFFELVEAVVVPETWFFRDDQAFAELTRIVAREWLHDRPQRTFRVLSVPCSTGEEPYSAAMALLDAGIAADRVRIEAVDISKRALTQARRAVYGQNSFRGSDLTFRERHFEPVAGLYRLRAGVREAVEFQHGNLLAADFLLGSEIYDVIFCRNVLIYFDEATRNRAVDVLQRLLKPDGVLFVGPAEADLMLHRDFVSSKAPMAFAFRKQDDTRTVGSPRRTRPQRPRAASPRVSGPRELAATSTPVMTAPPRTQETPASDIESAVRLADQGRFSEAVRVCQEHVRAHGPSARAFKLMGMMCNATGDLADATANFRKALYLDANDLESLIHLAFLAEKQGDVASARVLRSRMRRLEVTDGH